MKTNRTLILSALLLGAGLLLTTAASAASCGCGTAPEATAPAAATTAATAAPFDLAQAKAAYPLDTCVVLSEKLEGDMGGPIDYIHKEAGKPDRLVRLCCKACLKDFKKDPAAFLKKIDDAAAAKPANAGHMP